MRFLFGRTDPVYQPVPVHRSKYRAESFKSYWILGAAILVSIFITSLFIASYPTALLTISIGVAMIIVALNGLIGFKFNIGPGIGWQLGFGIVSGVLGGVSSIWSPPVAMYLIARGIDKERFISATGFLFLSEPCHWHWGYILAVF